MANKLTVGKQAFTIYGGTVEIVSVKGNVVKVKDVLFGSESELALNEVFHSRQKAWGGGPRNLIGE